MFMISGPYDSSSFVAVMYKACNQKQDILLQDFSIKYTKYTIHHIFTYAIDDSQQYFFTVRTMHLVFHFK